MEQLKKVSIVSVPYTLFFQYNCQHENVLNWIQVMKISHLDIPNQALNWMFDSLVKTGEYVDIILLVLEEFSGHVYSICKTWSPSCFSVSSVCCPENSCRAVVEKFVQRGAQNASEFALKWPLATRSPISVRLSAAVWQHCIAPKMFEKYSVRLWLSQKTFYPELMVLQKWDILRRSHPCWELHMLSNNHLNGGVVCRCSLFIAEH